jgi:hypothetical protein
MSRLPARRQTRLARPALLDPRRLAALRTLAALPVRQGSDGARRTHDRSTETAPRPQHIVADEPV